MKRTAVMMAVLFVVTIGLYVLNAGLATFDPPPESTVRPVDSEVFRAVGYRAATETLTVVFRRGDTYEYLGVPRACYEGLILTRSKGSYFNSRIRGRFPCRRIGQP